jgi:hypothetical protein
MPSVNSPYGFRASFHPSGTPIRFSAYKIASGYAVNVFQGDVVKAVDTGTIQIATSDGTRSGTAGGIRVLGVFNTVQYVDTSGLPTYKNWWPAGTVATDITAWVSDDTEIRYTVQYTNPGTPGTDTVQTAVFEQCDWAGFGAPGGSSQLGTSTSYLGPIESSGTGQFQIVGIAETVNQSPTDAYVNMLVRINEGTYKAETPSV